MKFQKKQSLFRMDPMLGLFFLCALGMAGGVLYLVPKNERIGNTVTFLCAVLAGIFYTRYMKKRRGK